MTSTRDPLYPGIRYRAYPTGRDYTFTFAYVAEAHSWRAYVQDSPAYSDRPSDSHSTHRLRDQYGPYVCWDAQISSLSECQGVAALWADCTENYLSTGQFAPPDGRPTIQDRSNLADVSPPRARAATAAGATSGSTDSPHRLLRRLLRRW